jgi:maleylacetate reductase
MRAFSTPGDVFNATPARIVFGAGSSTQVAAEVERLHATRALVVSTPGRSAMAQAVVDALGAQCIGLLPEAVSQVPIELARRAQARARELGTDCIVSVGGGASVGLGKAIALELAVPVIAIPTTYSGSEMTGFCGITIEGVKRMHKSLRMLASCVIYDPELTVNLPVPVAAASAMNALAHCVDAVVVASCSPTMAMAAAEGARVIAAALPAVVLSPEDLNARTALMYGGYLGGAALTGGFALQHGVAHVLGGSFNVAHSTSHALVLPHVAAHHAAQVPQLMEPLARAMGVPTGALGAAIFDLLASLQLPTSLREIGFAEQDLDRVAQISIDTDNGENPYPVTLAAVRRMLDDIYNGTRPVARG